MVSALAVAGGVIGFAFAGFTGWRYLKKGRINNLCWTVGLVLWGLVSLLEAFADPATGGWDANAYRIYYVHSASLVALLGAGTVYLLKEQKFGNAFLAYTILVALAFSVASGFAATNPVELAKGGSIGGSGWAPEGAWIRSLTFLLTIPGSLILIGGAFLSWWRTKTVYNLLIGIGAIVIALAGVIARFVSADYIPLGNILSISLMFIGFLYATEEMRVKSDQAAAAAKPAV